MTAARATYILAIDQGTTSTRAMVFDAAGKPCAQAQRELEQHYPQPRCVEHDAEEICQATLHTSRGTLACFRLWRLSGGAVHATDANKAARPLVCDIRRQDWDDALLALFRVPRALLPEVRNNAADFGGTAAELFGAPIAVAGMAGDQQAAMIGQACFAPGMIKSTYGTGCFAVLNTGADALQSRHRLLTTLAYRIAGKPTYAIEGSIFVAGAAGQWLRDGLKLIARAAESEAPARSASPTRWGSPSSGRASPRPLCSAPPHWPGSAAASTPRSRRLPGAGSATGCSSRSSMPPSARPATPAGAMPWRACAAGAEPC